MNKTKTFISGIILILSGYCFDISAQIKTPALLDNTGLQIGFYYGQTALDDQGLNYTFRLYSQQPFSDSYFGELSFSYGMISGVGYRSQLSPLEYRLGVHLERYGVPRPKLFGRYGSLYGYAGLGILYNRPLEIAAPDDPLTVEMGNSLPSSSFWDFNGGFAPFIPIGVGFDLPLDPGATLNISTGYNQALSFLKFNSNEVPNGYWAFSIGIDFKRNKKRKPVTFTPPPIKPYNPPPAIDEEKVAEAADISVQLVSMVNSRPINFEVLSSTLDQEEKKWLREVANMLKLNPDLSLRVYGHADSTGTEEINQMISESRARSVWLNLLEEDVDPSQLELRWLSDDRPLDDNSTKEGRYANRRAELKTTFEKFPAIRKPADDEIYIASIFKNHAYGQPLFGGREIEFSQFLLEFDSYERMIIKLTAYLMHSKPEMDMVILSQADFGAGADLRHALAKARAERIKAELILKGIEHQRIKAAIPGTELYEKYGQHLKGNAQQNLLIPVQRFTGSKEGKE